MSRKIWITLALLTFAVPAGLAAAPADGDWGGPHGRHGRGEGPGFGDAGRGMGDGMHMRMLHRLDLTDRQKEQIKALRDDKKSERLALHKEMKRLQNRLHGEMLEDQPNKRSVIALAKEIDGVRSQLHVMRVEQWLAVRDLLTDEQRDELLAMPPPGPRGPHGRRGMGRRGQQGLHQKMMELHEGEPAPDDSQ